MFRSRLRGRLQAAPCATSPPRAATGLLRRAAADVFFLPCLNPDSCILISRRRVVRLGVAPPPPPRQHAACARVAAGFCACGRLLAARRVAARVPAVAARAFVTRARAAVRQRRRVAACLRREASLWSGRAARGRGADRERLFAHIAVVVPAALTQGARPIGERSGQPTSLARVRFPSANLPLRRQTQGFREATRFTVETLNARGTCRTATRREA